MLILGIETSCDDTSVAILRADPPSQRLRRASDKLEVLANVVSSQIVTHAPYGGIVPLLAAREHERNLPLVLSAALSSSKGLTMRDIDLIAVTSGPGLIMSLVRGVNFAKELARKYNKPLIGINHMEGHIYSNFLSTIHYPLFPALCLIVSGGHTELVLMRDHGQYELIGHTVDDAAGEAFDKIARILGLGYPGGPAIAAEAAKIENVNLKMKNDNVKLKIELPRPMLHSKNFNFSFAGLKTAVLYLVRDLTAPLDDVRAEIAHEAQEAIVDVLVSKTKKAAEKFKPKSILLAGGVSANKLLRSRLQELCSMLHVLCSIPPLEYTTDNAAMICAVAYYKTREEADLSAATRRWRAEADANWEIA